MNARRSDRLSTFLLDPELIHAGKNKRVLAFKDVPKIEVDHGSVAGKPTSEGLEDVPLEFEAEKFQPVFTHKGLDLGQRQLMFLNVKQEVAACARAEKILRRGCRPCRRLGSRAHELLAEFPDIFRAWAIAALDDEPARVVDILPCRSAVETQTHEPAGAQH